jgi:hypothetical protein
MNILCLSTDPSLYKRRTAVRKTPPAAPMFKMLFRPISIYFTTQGAKKQKFWINP